MGAIQILASAHRQPAHASGQARRYGENRSINLDNAHS
jgi:hypothetical protein